ITVRAKLHFQAVPPRWVEEMFAIDNDIINAMEDMYWEQGPSPVEMVSDELSSIVVGTNELYNKFSIGPNPAPNGQVTINGGKETIKNISVYDIKGKLVLTRKTNTIRTQVELPDAVGTYLIVVETNAGRHVEKVLRR
ncbi:MAG: T9SS type A sorting domain-containing protein, partial [Flavobacteriales bacterium]